MTKQASDAGIAIGPILFVIALLGILASVMAASGGGGFGSAGNADRVTADITGQANLIRNKINECYMQYVVNGVNADNTLCTDTYPCSDTTNGTLVSALTCPNDPLTGGGAEQSLWTGLRIASVPIATKGFADWKYINAGSTGGRCIWTAPGTGKNTASDVEGLTRAAAKFTTEEVKYDASSNTQKFVIIITPATGTWDSHCTAP